MAMEQSDPTDLVEGLDGSSDLGEYPLDSLLIRTETRTIFEVVRRIGQGFYKMDPEFQREFVWEEERQSRLIESVLMRIPLPVFYLAENPDGRLVVVDGLQRLTTFERFLTNAFKLNLRSDELNGKMFNELSPKHQNRIEDTQLTLYVIDSKVPERARLDIFERVNSGVPLSRQQMRNALYQGKATRMLRTLAHHPTFVEATGSSLQPKTMRDREAINRFCAFHLLGPASYRNDMDQFLAEALIQLNQLADAEVDKIQEMFLRSMRNNLKIFGKHAFRKHTRGQQGRSVFNMSLFDVFSTGLANYDEALVDSCQDLLRAGFYRLMSKDDFLQDITIGTNSSRRVEGRFRTMSKLLAEIFDAV